MAAHPVTGESAGQRLDQFLHTVQPEQSRSFLQKLIAAGDVRVHGQGAKSSYRVRAGDIVSIEIPAAQPLAALPENIPLAVLYEDADLIVLNKAAGIVVHPAAGNFSHTLVNALLHHCHGQLAGIGGVARPGIVHRLDKGTSGCLVVAKTDAAHQSLVAQFKARQVRKIYRAICSGTFREPTGRIATTIGRSAHDRKKMSAQPARGRPALTEYRVLRQHAEWALVELTLHTGRTHQIRVHMAHIGHGLVGDVTYGWRHAKIAVERPLLHAYKLAFTHPRTGQPLEFVAPIPEDMTRYE